MFILETLRKVFALNFYKPKKSLLDKVKMKLEKQGYKIGECKDERTNS